MKMCGTIVRYGEVGWVEEKEGGGGVRVRWGGWTGLVPGECEERGWRGYECLRGI